MIDSPCIDLCTTDPESGLCIGCGRTPEEIENWVSFSEKQKEQVLKNLDNRNKISTIQDSMIETVNE
jgi:predicted Fe-S protein YdhL (DUF1289 family)